MQNQIEMESIVSHFNIKGTVSCIAPLGNGLINTTYKVETVETDQPNYVLQHVNTDIFPDIDMLMDNIVSVTNHIRKKLIANNESDIDRKTLTFIPTKEGKYYYFDGKKYWRIMVFIPDTITKTEINEDTSYNVGLTFGNFESMLADIPEKLGETIKDFHNMEFRLQQLRDAVKEDKAGRVKEMTYYLSEIEKRSKEMTKAETLYREGKLPKRICHCDTKVDNMLFDKSGNVLCVIDLDTVMPSFVFSDFGDFLRSAANTGKEDDKNLDNVSFNMDIFKAFTRGYLKSGKSFLTSIEIENLPYAAKLFPYMQCVRFLTDYLNGDTYYKIQYPEHNLVRTKAQFKLMQSVEDHEEEMSKFVNECLNSGI